MARWIPWTLSLTLLSPVALLPGCDTDPGDGSTQGTGDTEDSSDSSDSSDTDASDSGDSEGTQTGTTGEPEAVELGRCGLALDCEQWSDHGLDVSPDTALLCAAELGLSGDAGVLSYQENYGEATFTDYIVILLGDGTALRQSRLLDGAPDGPTVELGEQQLCDVALPTGLEEDCADPEGDCWWSATVENCESVADWTCEEALAAVPAE